MPVTRVSRGCSMTAAYRSVRWRTTKRCLHVREGASQTASTRITAHSAEAPVGYLSEREIWVFT